MMKRPLFATDRCTLFKNLASEVWSKIIYAHAVGVDLPEIGITADIIVEILQYAKNHISNFDVFAKPGWNEQLYGSDLDIFIEVQPNQFRWFALQAKVLKKNNRYDTLRDSSDTIMQWDKLALLEGASGCKGYYLLYNGKFNYRNSNIDICKQKFAAEQFGCSIVEPADIKTFALKKGARGIRHVNPRFEDFHPRYAQPWRTLVCCYLDITNSILYSREEILASNPRLQKLGDEIANNNDDPDNEILKTGGENLKNGNDIPVVQDNRINIAMREANWDAGLRIITYATSFMNFETFDY